MPVTFTIAKHPATEWASEKVTSIKELFVRSCANEHGYKENPEVELIRDSFDRELFEKSHISASTNGFVWAIFRAYSHHHNLFLRPEDVWFTILTQLSFFINAHAEELRHLFVSHKGQKKLEVVENGSLHTVDFGKMAIRMTKLMQEHLVDPELRNWIMPAFSTTTDSDRVVAAVLMMGSLQKYFEYTFSILCGIPSVTLLGEREDWALLVTKLTMLGRLGDEPARFAQLLRPILNHFVASFDNPQGSDVQDFWGRCAHRESGGSGPSYLSGWISVFCFWSEKGQLLYPETIYPPSSQEFQARETDSRLDHALSRRIDTDKVPLGYATVPVIVNDHGYKFDAVMLAGMIGIQATPSAAGLNDLEDHGEPVLDSIQPLSGWLMYRK